MDEFGVLTERYGLKPQGKSVPMSQAKRSTATASTAKSVGFDSGFNRSSIPSSSKSSWDSSPGDDRSFFPKQQPQNSFGLGDGYGFEFGDLGRTATKQSNMSNHSSNGSLFDLDSMFNPGPKSSSTSLYVDDVFGEMPDSNNASNDDIFGSFTSSKNGSAADLLGDFTGVAAKLKNSSRNSSWGSAKNEAGFDDLIPGFGGTSPPVNRTNTKTTKSTEDPFVVLESASRSVYNSSETPTDPLEDFGIFNQPGGEKYRGSSNATPPLRPPPKPARVLKEDKVKSSSVSQIDELEDFAMGTMRNTTSRSKEAEDAKKKPQERGEDDLESYFGVSFRSNSVPKSRAATLDPMFDTNVHNRQQKTSAAVTVGIDDLSSIFGDAPMFGEFGEFEEVEGETEERRRARLGRHQRTQDRVARAVADMNQRDRQSQHEQEERRRIAEAMDFEIKRWAAGKEGNMRALLSSLQQVLWAECGWEPVSLTDLITSGSVKKVYRKATLCVHPDKVQQKGATLEQKYIAEKVFDILKEAWNKFNKEELS